MHTYYQPNETEQQFIAAGIMSAEMLDKDYQEYLSKEDGEFTMSYQSWQNAKRYWDDLNKMYVAEIEPNFPDNMTPELEKRADYLIREMGYLEQALGY